MVLDTESQITAIHDYAQAVWRYLLFPNSVLDTSYRTVMFCSGTKA